MTPVSGITLLVCGISGVGKTSLIQSTTVRFPVALRWRASEIIGETRGTTDPERLRALRPKDLQRSQELLIQGFRARRGLFPDKLVILDAHSVIDTDDGFFEVPVDVVSRLRPAGIIHVASRVDQIEARRTTDPARTRPKRSAIQLAEYQKRSKLACERYRDALGIPLIHVDSGDNADFAHAIDVIVATGVRANGESV
jgi:adenylate kinase